MSRVLFIQNGDGEGPGLFVPALEASGVELETVHAWRGDPVPVTSDEFDGVAIGGGSMSAYETDRYPFLGSQIALLQAVRAAGKPFLGMCLGAQLMAAAFGGKVFANTEKEIGFHEVRFTAAAEQDALWHDHTAPFHPVNWHGDTFTLPPGAELLASSTLTPHQLIRLDDTLYGFQFHLEIGLPLLREMVASDDASLRGHGVDPATFLRAGDEYLPAIEATAHSVFTRWAGLLG
jgi:GMP synthase-like glutamine amidotransferase